MVVEYKYLVQVVVNKSTPLDIAKFSTILLDLKTAAAVLIADFKISVCNLPCFLVQTTELIIKCRFCTEFIFTFDSVYTSAYHSEITAWLVCLGVRVFLQVKDLTECHRHFIQYPRRSTRPRFDLIVIVLHHSILPLHPRPLPCIFRPPSTTRCFKDQAPTSGVVIDDSAWSTASMSPTNGDVIVALHSVLEFPPHAHCTPFLSVQLLLYTRHVHTALALNALVFCLFLILAPATSHAS